MRRLVNGLAAALGLALIAVGVPWLLVAVAGWPLPTKPPDWSNVYWSARQNNVPAEFVIKSLAVVAWVAWLQLMWAVVWELTVNVPRTLRGQRSVSVPWSFGVTARLARTLVAPLMLLTTFVSSAPTVAAPALVELSPLRAMGGTGAPVAAVVSGVRVAPVSRPVWVVAPGDSLWDVAERCLGDGSRVDDVLACNPGLTATTRLRAGETLRLPDEAVVPADRATPGERTDPSTSRPDTRPDGRPDTRIVQPGDTLWDIAGDELDDPLRWPELFAANAGRTFADGRTLDDPDLIQPGWDLVVPPVPTADEAPPEPTDPAPATPTAQPDPVVTDGPAPDPLPVSDPVAASTPATAPAVEPIDRAPTAPPPAPTSARGDEAGRPAPTSAPHDAGRAPVNRWADPVAPPVAGESAGVMPAELLTMERAAMMSAGVLLLLAVRRRQRLRGAPLGARPVPSRPAPAATERTLRSVGSGERFARVELAVRASAMQMIRFGRRPVAALVAPDGAVELVASGPLDLGAPWEGAGARWTLPAGVPIELLAPEARRVAAPTPALVQIGGDGGRDVYVDLEALGALQIDAGPDDADAIVTAIATTLATSVLAEVTTLVGVSVDQAAFCGHRHHTVAADLADGLAVAVDAVGSTAVAQTPTFELRARATGGETWEPAVVLVGHAAGEAALPFVPRGVAVVSAAPVSGPSSVLAPDGDAWILRPAGLRFTPIGLGPAELAEVADLLDVPEPAPPDPLDELTDTTPPAASCDLLVRLIGPVRIETASGEPVEFERSKTRELIAWLATHRERSTRTLARTALWEVDVRDATFANVVSEARRALARAVPPPDGDEWVGRTLTEDLPLHDAVRTDADLLVAALAAARVAPPAEAIAALRPAVDLLAGTPFEGTAYLWPDPEGITSNLVVLATSAASELAAQYLAVGDLTGVFAATDRGLRVLPGHEELIGLRMRAHAQAGDHAGVRQEWESYARTLAADPWSDGEPSPKLAALRAELLGGVT